MSIKLGSTVSRTTSISLALGHNKFKQGIEMLTRKRVTALKPDHKVKK